MIHPDHTDGYPNDHGARVSRQAVTERRSHANHDQVASGAITYVSTIGAGRVRFPSDRIVPGHQTVTLAEYRKKSERIFNQELQFPKDSDTLVEVEETPPSRQHQGDQKQCVPTE